MQHLGSHRVTLAGNCSGAAPVAPVDAFNGLSTSVFVASAPLFPFTPDSSATTHVVAPFTFDGLTCDQFQLTTTFAVPLVLAPGALAGIAAARFDFTSMDATFTHDAFVPYVAGTLRGQAQCRLGEGLMS